MTRHTHTWNHINCVYSAHIKFDPFSPLGRPRPEGVCILNAFPNIASPIVLIYFYFRSLSRSFFRSLYYLRIFVVKYSVLVGQSQGLF